MREMKDSGIEWIGAIPAAWGVHRIASHFQEIKEKNTANAYSNALQFKMGKIIAKPQKWDEDETNETYSAYTVVHPNTIMINGLNLEFDFVTQRVARVECNGIITSAYIALSPRNDINAEYICYLLKSYDACRAFHSMGRGLRKILSYSELKNKPIVVPPLAKQEHIAAFLDAECAEIDAVLEKTRASIEEYKKLKQAVITQAVTKGVRGDRPMKDSGIEWIGDIPAEWEIRKIFRAINKVGDIDHYMPDSVDDGIPYLMTGDLQEKLSDVNLKRCKKVSFQDYEMLSSKIRVSKGDVIFARYATIGTVCFVDTEDNILVSYACLIIKPNSSLLYGEFLFYYLKSTAFLEEIKQYIKANTQANVGLDSVSKAKIALPSVHEQQKIVEYLRDKCKKIDALIAKKQQYLTEIENYKKSLIYEYVTGKKEVKTSVLAD